MKEGEEQEERVSHMMEGVVSDYSSLFTIIHRVSSVIQLVPIYFLLIYLSVEPNMMIKRGKDIYLNSKTPCLFLSASVILFAISDCIFYAQSLTHNGVKTPSRYLENSNTFILDCLAVF